MNNDRLAALKKLQMADFALVEANLYLDTHPNCQNGLDYFRRKRAEKKRALEEYEERFGPIMAVNSKAEGKWGWIDKPWPWEMEE